jgi:iron complex transport system substrate-binding protein
VRRPLAGLVILVAALAGQPAAAPPATQPAAQAPRRIISLVPAVTEMLFAIGAASQVVGVSSFDEHPPEVLALPRVGALVDPDLEAIFELRPDLVVVYATQTDLRAQLERAGIPMYVYQHAGLPDVITTIADLGKRVGRDTEAAKVVRTLRSRLDAVAERTRSRPAVRTLLVFGRQPGALRGIYASGAVGFLNDVLKLAGGRNVFEDVPRQSVQVSAEMILTRQPDAIVELKYGTSEPTGSAIARERESWATLASVPAVREGRVVVLVGDHFVVPGPRIAEGAEQLARALHPDLFPDGATGGRP